jgi:hypothetical protein
MLKSLSDPNQANWPQAQVAEGVAFLNQVSPGWQAKINVSILDSKSIKRDVLGQLYGDSIKAKNKLFADHAPISRQVHSHNLGFGIEQGNYSDRERDWPELDREWKRAILGI